MKPLAIYGESRFDALCAYCGQRLRWAKLVNSERWMPFDQIVVLENDLHHPDILYVRRDLNHFATCRDRRRLRRAARSEAQP